MALSNPYCTVANVRNELQNSSADQTLLEEAINDASRYIDWYKGRDYFEHDFTGAAFRVKPYSNIVFGSTLFAPFGRIVSVTSITEGTTSLTEDTDYIVETTRIVRINQGWTLGADPDDHIQILGKFGYDQAGDSTAVPTGIPGYVRRAAIITAAALSGQNKKEVIGLDGTKEEIIDKAIPPTVKNLLGTRNKILV